MVAPTRELLAKEGEITQSSSNYAPEHEKLAAPEEAARPPKAMVRPEVP